MRKSLGIKVICFLEKKIMNLESSQVGIIIIIFIFFEIFLNFFCKNAERSVAFGESQLIKIKLHELIRIVNN
jgi:hypothetical protein